MGKIERVGGILSVAVSIWDRYSAWRKKRIAARASARAERTERDLKRISDRANKRNGQ